MIRPNSTIGSRDMGNAFPGAKRIAKRRAAKQRRAIGRADINTYMDNYIAESTPSWDRIHWDMVWNQAVADRIKAEDRYWA